MSGSESIHTDEFDKVLDIKGKRNYYTRNKDELVSPLSVPKTDVFVEKSVSASISASLCRKLIAAFDYSDDDLKVKYTKKVEVSDKYDWKFSGQYAHLRPIFDAIESQVMEFGDDINLNVRKSYTAFMRNYCFVALRVTKEAIGIGLSLDESIGSDRLKNTPNWGGWARLNRGISVSNVEDIDDQLVEWMKQSYDRS